MKKLLVLSSLVLTLTANSQILGAGGVNGAISNLVGQIDESSNYFSLGEISIELGGVYVQKTGEGGVLLDVAKWDVGIQGLGLGAQFVDSASQPAAEFGYLAYRKTLGNSAVWGFAGMGYNEIDKQLMGVIGLGLEHRSSKHISEFTKIGYAIQAKRTGDNSRGLVVGAGVQYNF